MELGTEQENSVFRTSSFKIKIKRWVLQPKVMSIQFSEFLAPTAESKYAQYHFILYTNSYSYWGVHTPKLQTVELTIHRTEAGPFSHILSFLKNEGLC